MRFRDLSSPEIAALDAEPWDGFLAGAMRPLSMRTLIRIYLTGIVLILHAALLSLAGSAVLRDELAHPLVLRGLGAGLLIHGIVGVICFVLLSPRSIRRVSPAAWLVGILLMGVVSSVGLWTVGPSLASPVVFYFEALPFAFYTLTRPWALLAAGNAAFGCGVVMALQDGWRAAPGQWLLVTTTLVLVAWIVGSAAERAERLADSEHAARVEVADLNRTLEERVAAQVTEIERLGELRRFLTPQVADAVMSADAEAITRPHRTRIAVFFCDLRGFTAFTRESEPEEVIADLDQYYRTVGEVLQRHDATIGGYAGDGIMAYLGDPVPHPDPARAAVAMVTDLRGPLDTLVAEWQRRGHDLSYGIGLAYGYATLGVVGFDGRYDYTPLGGVVNLAARLCGAATAGQVLLDHATYAELDGVDCEPVDGVELKGLGAPRAYALT